MFFKFLFLYNSCLATTVCLKSRTDCGYGKYGKTGKVKQKWQVGLLHESQTCYISTSTPCKARQNLALQGVEDILYNLRWK